MPRGKPKNTFLNDDDYEPGPSQAPPQSQSLTQMEKQMSSLSLGMKETKVLQIVQYLLIQDQKKIPIKKSDIVKHALPEHGKLFPMFIDEAAKKLKDIFGIELKEIDSKQKSYILVSCIDNDSDRPHQVWSDEDNSKMGLLMVVLSMIFMNGNIMNDSLLYHSLKKLGVDIEQTHSVFGDVRKLLTQEYVRQGYLEYQRKLNSDPPAYDYLWGPRAKIETSKRNVLQFVSEVFENRPEDWTSQFRDVEQSEGSANGVEDT